MTGGTLVRLAAAMECQSRHRRDQTFPVM